MQPTGHVCTQCGAAFQLAKPSATAWVVLVTMTHAARDVLRAQHHSRKLTCALPLWRGQCQSSGHMPPPRCRLLCSHVVQSTPRSCMSDTPSAVCACGAPLSPPPPAATRLRRQDDATAGVLSSICHRGSCQDAGRGACHPDAPAFLKQARAPVRLETKFKPSGSPPVTTTSLRARGLDSTAHPPPAAQKVSSGFVGGHGCLVAWVCGVVLQGMQALTTWVTCLFGKSGRSCAASIISQTNISLLLSVDCCQGKDMLESAARPGAQ